MRLPVKAQNEHHSFKFSSVFGKGKQIVWHIIRTPLIQQNRKSSITIIRHFRVKMIDKNCHLSLD